MHLRKLGIHSCTMFMEDYIEMAERIVAEQSLIMGPIAWEEAGKVEGLRVNKADNSISFQESSKSKDVLSDLVNRYQRLFGQASVDVCKNAVSDLIAGMTNEQIPTILLE